MRILILGGDGMLGHQLLLALGENHDVRVTLRLGLETYAEYQIFSEENCYDEIDLRQLHKLGLVVDEFNPNVIINAVGIIKQRDDAEAVIPSIEINALLPHRLGELCKERNIRLIHFSTDCVFSGDSGNYKEDDFADAKDLYGRTKYLGEVNENHCLTIRTSMIGLELSRRKSLVEWFLAQKGEIRGFTKAIYSGLTTIELCRVVERIIMDYPNLSGVYQVASEPISKYELLCALAEKLGSKGKEIVINPDDSFVCDRSLSSEKFNKDTGYVAPSWDWMLSELAVQISEREKAQIHAFGK